MLPATVGGVQAVALIAREPMERFNRVMVDTCWTPFVPLVAVAGLILAIPTRRALLTIFAQTG